MMTKTFLLVVAAGLMVSCQTETARRSQTSPETQADPAANMATGREEMMQARTRVSERLNRLDAQIGTLEERAQRGTATSKAKVKAEAAELRAEANRLRDRMGTWDEKAESGWQTVTREMEEGLDKIEDRTRKLIADIKD